MASEYVKIGRVAPSYMGVWDAGHGYLRLDIIANADKTRAYIARKDVPAGTPLTDEDYWALLLDVNDVLGRLEDAIAIALRVVDSKANAIQAEASGNPVTVYADGGSAIVPVGATTYIPVQSGSGEPSADNIMPLSGYDALELSGGAGSVSTAIGETVYGGTMDWDGGVFTVTHGYMLLTGSENGWSAGAGNFFIAVPGILNEISDLYSDQFVNAPSVGVNSLAANQMRQGATPTNVVFGNPANMTADAWKARLAANPVQLVYKLETPRAISLAPETLRAAEGFNAVGVNGANLTVRYNRSVNMLLEEVLETVADMVESGKRCVSLPAWAHGYLNAYDGREDNDYVPANRARSTEAVYLPEGCTVEAQPGYMYRFAMYADREQTLFLGSNTDTFTDAAAEPETGCWARFTIRRTGNDDIDLAAAADAIRVTRPDIRDQIDAAEVTAPECGWVYGYIDAETGEEISMAGGIRLATRRYLRALEGSVVEIAEGELLRAAMYSAPDAESYLGSVPDAGFYTGPLRLTIPRSCYIRVTAARANDAAFAAADGSGTGFELIQDFGPWAEAAAAAAPDPDYAILEKGVRYEAIAPMSDYVPFEHPEGYAMFPYYADLATLYGAWDALIEESDGYLTKEVLGMDASGQYEIWHITAKERDPYWPEVNSGIPKRYPKPKIILSATLHGMEKSAAFATYYLMRDMIRSCGKNDTLYYLRYCVDWEIIPVLNPWGYSQVISADGVANDSNKTYAGININRAFEPGFVALADSGDYYYGGSKFTSESNPECIEALYLKRLLDANRDAVHYCDFHANNDAGPLYIYHNFAYTEDETGKHVNQPMYDVSLDSVEHLIRRYRADYDAELGWSSSSANGQIVLDPQQGQSYAYAQSIGIHGQVTEAMLRIDDSNERPSTWCSEACMRINTRSIGVWFHMLLYKLYEISKSKEEKR